MVKIMVKATKPSSTLPVEDSKAKSEKIKHKEELDPVAAIGLVLIILMLCSPFMMKSK